MIGLVLNVKSSSVAFVEVLMFCLLQEIKHLKMNNAELWVFGQEKCVRACVRTCACVCVCVSKWKRECQANGKHYKRKSQAQWKEKYRTGRGPFRRHLPPTSWTVIIIASLMSRVVDHHHVQRGSIKTSTVSQLLSGWPRQVAAARTKPESGVCVKMKKRVPD